MCLRIAPAAVTEVPNSNASTGRQYPRDYHVSWALAKYPPLSRLKSARGVATRNSELGLSAVLAGQHLLQKL